MRPKKHETTGNGRRRSRQNARMPFLIAIRIILNKTFDQSSFRVHHFGRIKLDVIVLKFQTYI